MKMTVEFNEYEIMDMIRDSLRGKKLLPTEKVSVLKFRSSTGAELSGVTVSVDITDAPSTNYYDR